MKLAINDFHKHFDPGSALRYLRDLFATYKLNSPQRGAEAEFTLSGYAAWYEAHHPIVAASKVRLDLDLGHDVVLGGEVSRVDVLMPEDGYSAVLLGEFDANNWKAQLRMPLIQKAVGIKFERDPKDVTVGVQRLDGSDLRLHSYSARTINAAETEAQKLARTISRLLAE